MQLSRRGDYSIRAMLDVASAQAGTMVLTREIAERQSIPLAFLTKIISRLAQAGLLRSFRGSSGGVLLGRPAEDISLLDVVEAVEGPIAFNRCLIRKGECPRDETCPVHVVWQKVQNDVVATLKEATLAELASNGTFACTIAEAD